MARRIQRAVPPDYRPRGIGERNENVMPPALGDRDVVYQPGHDSAFCADRSAANFGDALASVWGTVPSPNPHDRRRS